LTAPTLDRPFDTQVVPVRPPPPPPPPPRAVFTLPRADAPYCGKLGRKSETCPDDQTGCAVC
jgi:hypothetical protein